MRAKSLFILIVFAVQILSVIGQVPEISISSIPNRNYTLLPPANNTAEILVLTQNVTLQANIVGIWEKPNKDNTTSNSINFGVFTVDLAGLYKFYADNVNGSVLSIQIVISATGGRFTELTSPGVYNILSGNEVFYTDTTLVCVTSEAIEPVWSYRETQDGDDITPSGVGWVNSTGISTLDIQTTEQGYYTCTPIAGGTSYTVAIFNSDVTTEAIDGGTYYYTKGVDPSDIQLLCNTTDLTIALDDIGWNIALPYNSQNPIILNTFLTYYNRLDCYAGGQKYLEIHLRVQGPPTLTLSYENENNLFSPSDSNTVSIRILTQFTLQTNLKGKWLTDDSDSEIPLQVNASTRDMAGVYGVNVIAWNNTEVLVIQLEISATGTNFAELTSPGVYNILSGNEVFYTDTTLVCVTSEAIEPVWSYRETQNGNSITPSGVEWVNSTGISTLDIKTTEQGYYTCTPIAGGTSYTVAIFNSDVTTEAIDGGTYYYTKGVDPSDIQLLCNTTDLTIALDDIGWNIALPYNSQNPIILNSFLTYDDGLECYAGRPNHLEINLRVQGPPTLTLSYENENNLFSPSDSNTVSIRVLTQFTLQTNLKGKWLTDDSDSEIPLQVNASTRDMAGVYGVNVIAWNNTEVLVIQLEISATGTNFAELTSPGVYNILSGNEVFYTDTTLVCATSEAIEPVWSYRETQDGDDITPSGVEWVDSTGISTLAIKTTEQGYYTCTPITGGTNYTVAIFNSDVTIEAIDGGTYYYTNDVDPIDIQLLCTTNDLNVALESIEWNNGAIKYINPVILYDIQNSVTTWTCNTGNKQVNLNLQGPPLLTLNHSSLSTPFSTSTSGTYSIRILTKDVILTSNLKGKWQSVVSSSDSDTPIQIGIFTRDKAGLYSAYVTPWNKSSDISAIQLDISVIGVNFAQLTSPGVYKFLSGYEVFYTDTTLVCATSDTTEPQWSYTGIQNINPSGVWDVNTGISTLSIQTAEQGYYTCSEGTSYTASIFDPGVTTVATQDKQYSYTKGVDSSDIQLLCTDSSNRTLSTVKWGSFGNPVLINDVPNQESTAFSCTLGFATIVQVELFVQGPPVITLSTTPDTIYSILPTASVTNTADIVVLSKNVILGTNLIGEWKIPDGSLIQSNSIEFELFTANLAGVYEFYITDWNGIEVLAIQITISAISNFAELSQGEYTMLSGNNVFYDDTTLVCATSDTSTEPEWSRDGATVDEQVLDPVTGISTLNITTSKQGYYTCTPITGTIYTVAIFNPDITIFAQNGDTYYYTKDIDPSNIQLLCTTDSNTALESLNWDISGQTNRNPVILNEIPNSITKLNCFAGQVTADLRIQGPPVITLSTTPDSTYSMLPTATDINNASIPVLSENVMLQTNLMGRWEEPDGSSTNENFIKFTVFTVDFAGIYDFHVTNWENKEEIAIQIDISAIGTGIGTETDSIITSVSSNTIFYQDTITLIAATSKVTLQSGDVVWSYQQSFNTTETNIPETSNDVTKSISKLNLDTKPSGYYTVSIRDDSSLPEQYILGVFNTTNIYDTRKYTNFTYTSGIDMDELLLCIPPNTYSRLAHIMWRYETIDFPNPVNFETISLQLGTINNANLKCVDITNSSVEFAVITINILSNPMITIRYLEYSISAAGMEDNAPLEIVVYTPNVRFECNKLECSWERNDSEGNPISTEREFTIPYLTIDNNREYTLYTLDNDNVLVPSVSITIKPIGTAFLTITQADNYQVLITNSIINMTGNTSLACATSYTPAEQDDIMWFYQETSIAESVTVTGDFDPIFGLSILTTDRPGYYTCRVSDEIRNKIEYNVAIIDNSIPTLSIAQEDFESDSPFDFKLGQPLRYSYENENIPITAIRWGIERVVSSGSDSTSELQEFLNPIDINEVFAQFGSGAFKFSCFYRQSPITFVGNLSLNMRDTASLMVVESDQGTTIFNDTRNSNFPEPESIDIAIVSKNVVISCSLNSCTDLIEKDGDVLSSEELNIDSLRIENDGLYSLRRTTTASVEYSTAAFYLKVTGYIAQNIIALNSSIINDTSVRIFWELLQDNLPDADETFKITYQALGGVNKTAGTTTELFYNLTDLVAGQTYTVWVELSYAYTFKRPTMSIKVTIPAAEFPWIYVLIIVILIGIVVLIAIAAVLIILYFWKLRKNKVKKFEVLETDEIPPETNNKTSQKFSYSQVPIDNPVYNPELTESIGVKSKFKESARNSGAYQNLKEVMDPSMEPIPLPLFKGTIDRLWGDETTLENEYRSLGGETLRYECGYAQLDQNRIKNKYKFIYPYDKSRVVLKKLGKVMHSDYINASNIPGSYVKDNFIAAQGPKENTVKDFWRMVFELKILNIVMVTNCVEGGKPKCEAYFPSKDGETSEFAPYKVRTTSALQSKGHITRIFNIETAKEKFQVKHFHFTAWPDHDVPSLHDELLQFIGYVQENITPGDAPILVHCSAGVGRTGTFITLFNLRAAILKQQPISIYKLVHEMREHRPHMVQTYRQYKFIYLAVLELLQEKTAIHTDEFLSTFQNYMESAGTGDESEFAKQFSELNYQCDKSFAYSSDKGEENDDKNPVKDVLPFDNNRVMIYSPFFTCNYINASYHDDFFITTQHPTANTLLDFLQMVYETNAGLVVMFTTSREKNKILGNLSDRKAYWPHKDLPLEVPPFQVEVVNSEKTNSMIRQKISLKNLKENSEHEFLQIISTTWNERGEPIDFQCIVNVLRFITTHRQKFPHSPIILHCVDSIGKTAIVFSVYQCIKEMQETGEIDIFHTVKRLRRERMKFIPNLYQFQACFTLMRQYLES